MSNVTAERLEESLWDLLKHGFEEGAHPRGRGGKWIDKVGGEVAGEAKKVGRKLERQPIQRRDRDITTTEAFRRGMRRISYMHETGRHGDEFMYDLATDEGFAGHPQVVDEEELRQHIADGDLEMFRGVSDESYAQAFTSGVPFYGQGFRGNGIYAASGERAHGLAVAYAQAPPSRGTIVTKVDAPRVIHMALRRDANMISYDDAVKAAREDSLRWAAEKSGDERTTRAQVLAEAYSTPTRWALAHGFDAVLIPKGDTTEVAVLNRTALIVAREFEHAGENVTRHIHEAEETE